VVIPPDARQVDATGKYLMPGMIELHSHAYHPAMVVGSMGKEPSSYGMLYAANNLRQALQAGITTVRDVTNMEYLDLSLRRAISEGVVLGPRFFVSGKGICMTGGHGWSLEGFIREADGPEDVRKAVRENVKAGVDLIKLLTTHRTHTPEFRQEELDAGVDEAHRLGRRVACHAASLPGTGMAVHAGVDTLEHGTFLTDETVAEMADKGTTWVPTCYVITTLPPFIKMRLDQGNLPYAQKRETEIMARWLNESLAELPRSFEKVLKKGVRIGTGTDVIAFVQPYAALPEEVGYLVQHGCTPMQAIESATRVSAEALGQGKDLGTVEKGKYADLIMVDRDPLKDIKVMTEVSWVMKGGTEVPFYPEYARDAGKRYWEPKG
jgi:imidazolonepropionase-like amidohydrolase